MAGPVLCPLMEIRVPVRFLRPNLNDTSGQILIIAAVSFSMLLGFMALAIDSGLLYRSKRNLQIAADAAATAGALDYLYNSSASSAAAAAKAASSQNGFTDGSSGVTVAVNDPPSSGPNASSAAFVEVVVSKPITMSFMSIFGFSTVTVKARAVAGVPAVGDTCVWVMANSGASMNLQGSYDIEAPGCGIYVNSPADNAFSTTGNGGTVNTKFLDVVGNSPPSHQTSPTPATINASPRKSPWGNLSGPTPSNGQCTTVDSTTTSITGTITGPGFGYATCYTNAVTISNATLGPGTYVFENGLTLSGTVNVNSGTLDVYSGTFSQGNATLNITAPTSGTYDGIAVMQPSTNTNQLQVQFGSSNQTLDGYIYAPGAQVYLQDHGGGTVATGVVSAMLYDKSSTIRIPSYDLAHSSTTPNRIVSIVE